MKRILFGALVLSTMGMMAQAPAAPATPRPPAKPGLTLTTAAFEDGGIIPDKYTAHNTEAGGVLSPKLTWTNVPDGTVSFAVICHDPEQVLQHTSAQYLHWLIFNIPGTATGLPEGVPGVAQLPDGSIQGVNTGRKIGYAGMGARAAGPYHHYTFDLYALDTKLTLGPDATQAQVVEAMQGHILGKGILVGRFHM